jgi:hypothetical protein
MLSFDLRAAFPSQATARRPGFRRLPRSPRKLGRNVNPAPSLSGTRQGSHRCECARHHAPLRVTPVPLCRRIHGDRGFYFSPTF